MKGDAAAEDRRREPGQIAHHAAAQRNDKGAAIQLGGEHSLAQLARLLEVFGAFPGRDLQKLGANAACIEAFQDSSPVKRADIAVGDDGAASLQSSVFGEFSRAAQEPAADQDRVAPRPQLHSNVMNHRLHSKNSMRRASRRYSSSGASSQRRLLASAPPLPLWNSLIERSSVCPSA